jgi:hypothetical protein
VELDRPYTERINIQFSIKHEAPHVVSLITSSSHSHTTQTHALTIEPVYIQEVQPISYYTCSAPTPSSHTHHLKHSNNTHDSRNSHTARHTHHTRATSKCLRSRRRRCNTRTLRSTASSLSLARRASNVLALCSRDTGNRRSGCRGRGPQGRSGVAVRCDGVLGGRLLEAVGAVVVADEDVGVDVA